MAQAKQPIWRLVQLCAQELTNNGITPFTRGDLIHCVQRLNSDYGPDSINPIIQGITDNLRGGAPGAVGKDILHSVGRGFFVLNGASRSNSKASMRDAPHSRSASLIPQRHKPTRTAKLPAALTKGDLRIGEYDFRFICMIELERQADGTIREYMPQTKYDNPAAVALNRYGRGPFCKFQIPRNIQIAGVYALVVGDDVRYIGECTALSSRYNMGYGNISPRNCFVGGQETNCRINNLVLQDVKSGLNVSLWFFETDEYKSVERKLRESVSLDWNRV